MAEDPKKNNELDLDEIDELPDVVLGEKTRAMRVVRENGDPAENENHPDSENDSEQPEPDFLTSGENTDEAVEEKNDQTDSLNISQPASEEEKEDVTSEQVNTSEENRESFRNEYHNDQEDDEEIPTSVIDNIPGVKNDLDNALKPQKTKHDETDPLPPVSDELSKVYSNSDATAVKGKHVAHADTDSGTHAFEQTGTGSVTAASETVEQTEPEKTDSEPEKEKTESETKKKKKKKTPLNQRIALFILIILLILLGIGVYEIYDSLQPVSSESSPVSFQIESGETIGDVTADLQKQGIIRDARTGYYYARVNHLTDVKRGVFQLDKSWSLKKIFTYLNDDKAADQDGVIVTLTEGDWAKDMADKIAASTDVKAEDLMALWNNDDYIRTTLMPKYPFLTEDIFNQNIKCDLEGYLAPDTYTFHKKTTAQEVTEKILDQTNSVYQKHATEIQNSGYSIHQIYTLASIVQGESSRGDQMKKIAGVFYNRLKQDMPLQSSVTTCYIIDFDKGKTDWQECEASYNTQKSDPYNTYQNKGLPPGPVQNPGDAAISATLNPDQNDYLFFMADVCGNTGIHYAKTQAEHEANVAKYNTCN